MEFTMCTKVFEMSCIVLLKVRSYMSLPLDIGRGGFLSILHYTEQKGF